MALDPETVDTLLRTCAPFAEDVGKNYRAAQAAILDHEKRARAMRETLPFLCQHPMTNRRLVETPETHIVCDECGRVLWRDA